MSALQIIGSVMDEWKAGIDSHDWSRVAAAFTDDADFQGLRPYGVGRQAASHESWSRDATAKLSTILE